MNRKMQYSLTLRQKINLFEKYKELPLVLNYNFPKPSSNPLLSVVIVQKNGLRYLPETLATIHMQDFRDYELIVVDGASTDGSKEYLKGISNIHLISESDNGMDEGFLKGLSLAKGKYVTHCCVSDGYLDSKWFSKAIAKLESDTSLSLVWGFPRTLDAEGFLKEVSYPHFHLLKPFHKIDYFAFWLVNGLHFPEGNYVVALPVMRKCFPERPNAGLTYSSLKYDPWLRFVVNFHSFGFLSSSIDSVANYGRLHPFSVSHSDQLDEKILRLKSEYEIQISKLRKSVEADGFRFFDRTFSEIEGCSSSYLIFAMFKVRLLLLVIRLILLPIRLIRKIGKLVSINSNKSQ